MGINLLVKQVVNSVPMAMQFILFLFLYYMYGRRAILWVD